MTANNIPVPTPDPMSTDYKNTINLPQDRFRDEGGSGQARTRHARRMGSEAALRRRSSSARRDASTRSSCTTVRRTRTASSTSAMRSTRSSRTSSSSRRCSPASARRTCRAGIATACRSRSRSRRTSARSARKVDAGDVPREVPRVRDQTDRPAARRFQAPRRARRLGKSVSHDGFPLRGGHDPRAGEDPCERATSCAASSRCTGASTAARRWPRPRSNITTSNRRRSMSPTTRSIRRIARGSKFGADGARSAVVAVPIWTTTPWTLPASLAVTLGPELEYVLVEGPAATAATCCSLLQ